MAWYDYLTSSGRNAMRTDELNQKAASQFRKDLGYEGGDVIPSGTMMYDDEGNEIGFSNQDKTMPAHGLLSDQNLNPDRMRAAANLMENGKHSLANGIISNQLTNSTNLRNTKRERDMLWKQMQESKARLAGTVVAGAPHSSPTGSNTKGNPIPKGMLNPNLRAPNIKPSGPLSKNTLPNGYTLPQTPDQKAQVWNQKYDAEIFRGVDPKIIEPMRKAKMSEIYGNNKTNLVRNYEYAKRNGYVGSFEDWKKAGNKIMTSAGGINMLNEQQKLKLGLLDPDGKPTRTPLYISSKGDIKAAPNQKTDTSERTSAAYASMMTNLEPELRELAPVNGFDQDLLRQEASETLRWLPFNMANLVNSPKGQKRKAGQDAWLNANGRDESGATIKDEEMDKYREYYFTSAFDSPEAIKFKAKLRSQAVEGMRMKSGKAAGIANNMLVSEYKLIASSNNMVYESHDEEYIYGVTASGQKKRIKRSDK